MRRENDKQYEINYEKRKRTSRAIFKKGVSGCCDSTYLVEGLDRHGYNLSSAVAASNNSMNINETIKIEDASVGEDVPLAQTKKKVARRGVNGKALEFKQRFQ